MSDSLTHLDVSKISAPSQHMHRATLDDDRLHDLADSIRAIGLLNPIRVRRADDGWQIIAGHRRLMAYRILGYQRIPAIIDNTDDATAWRQKAAENLQRAELSPYEEALAIADALNSSDITIEDVARQLHRSTDWCLARIALLDWPARLAQAVHHRHLSLAAARNLARVSDPHDLDWFLDQAIANGVTATTTAAWLQQWKARHAQPQEEGPAATAKAITAEPETYYQHCYACGTKHALQALSRLPFCQDCATRIRAATAANT